jgi:hypothetical protein
LPNSRSRKELRRFSRQYIFWTAQPPSPLDTRGDFRRARHNFLLTRAFRRSTTGNAVSLPSPLT